MKKLISILSLIVFVSCTPEDTAPVVPVVDDFDPSMSTLVGQGPIVGIGHTASGTASVYEANGKYTVVLDPYSSQNGPDLKIYLSKDSDASESIRLGDLQSTMGRQSYDVPGSPDIREYPFVHVWCEKYTVEFARAEIK